VRVPASDDLLSLGDSLALGLGRLASAAARAAVRSRSARLRMISTRQRGIYSIAHKKRAIVTNTIEKMMAKIASPKMVRLIATPSRSAYRPLAALSNSAARRSCCRGHRTWRT
jgi:hypothetical protein